MPKFEVPVNLVLYVNAESPEQAFGAIQVWFNSLLSGDFDKFCEMRQDGTIFPSSWNPKVAEIQDLAVKKEQGREV